MSLDQNLFTLLLTPNTSLSSTASESASPAGSGTYPIIDLADPSGTIHYRKRRIIKQGVYRMEVSDPLSEALLASATAPSATSKHKTLELYNPSKVVELKYTGTLTFRWSFKWEEHEFEWKREECYIIRKPDPPVLVAVTKEPPGRIKTTAVQILDYNLNRFDIDDRKGLEIVILTALLTFGDASDAYHEPNTAPSPSSTSNTSTPPLLKVLTESPWKSFNSATSSTPTPPPKPPPKKGVDRIAELQQGRGEVNEVSVMEEGAVKDYAKHCSQLLQDDAMLFISVRSSDAAQVPKVLQVVEETKRLRHKAGAPDLHQYVLHETDPTTHRGPRIIHLDDNDAGKGKTKEKDYAPPRSLTIHLSKIDMPELRPREGSPARNSNPPKRADEKCDGKKDRDKEKDRDKKTKERERGSPPIPPRSSQQHAVLHKHRSQYFPNHVPHPSMQADYAYPHPYPHPYPHTYPHPDQPPLPPRTRPPASGSSSGRRQSMYGALDGGRYHRTYDDDGPVGGPSSPPSSGLFGRLLGR